MCKKEAFYGSLASQHGLGYAGFARLLEKFGSPESVYGATETERREAYPRLSDAMAASLASGPRFDLWAGLVERCEAQAIVLTAPAWPGYPEPLLSLEAPPPLLYLRGEWRPEDARAVALVGTRTPTAYGREAAHTLARDLAAAGYTVVSGLAMGIDAAAHAGALAVDGESGGRTLAVIGCGLDIEYPLENTAVRARIEARSGENGAVISEFPPGTQPLPAHFPRRNRLISALSLATVVVEAGGNSGALLTAAHARNQHKPLFAVPGPIFSTVSSGTNALLRKGALLAASAEDITTVLERVAVPRRFLGPTLGSPIRTRRLSASGLPDAAPRARVPSRQEPDDPVLRLWGTDEVCALDALSARAGEQGLWPRGQAGAALLESLLQLELRGLVRRMPGAAYRRTGAGNM
jgi:DNA processing protein